MKRLIIKPIAQRFGVKKGIYTEGGKLRQEGLPNFLKKKYLYFF